MACPYRKDEQKIRILAKKERGGLSERTKKRSMNKNAYQECGVERKRRIAHIFSAAR